MAQSSTSPWPQMTPEEKAEHLRAVLDDFIARQNAAIARMGERLKAIEERVEQIDKEAGAAGRSR